MFFVPPLLTPTSFPNKHFVDGSMLTYSLVTPKKLTIRSPFTRMKLHMYNDSLRWQSCLPVFIVTEVPLPEMCVHSNSNSHSSTGRQWSKQVKKPVPLDCQAHYRIVTYMIIYAKWRFTFEIAVAVERWKGRIEKRQIRIAFRRI